MDLFSETEDEKIYLMFNYQFGQRKCALTGKSFECYFCLSFFLGGDPHQPVSPSTALDRGFTMAEDDFVKMNNQIDIYRSFKQGRNIEVKGKQGAP